MSFQYKIIHLFIFGEYPKNFEKLYYRILEILMKFFLKCFPIKKLYIYLSLLNILKILKNYTIES